PLTFVNSSTELKGRAATTLGAVASPIYLISCSSDSLALFMSIQCLLELTLPLFSFLDFSDFDDDFFDDEVDFLSLFFPASPAATLPDLFVEISYELPSVLTTIVPCVFVAYKSVPL